MRSSYEVNELSAQRQIIFVRRKFSVRDYVVNFYHDGVLRSIYRWKDVIKLKLNETGCGGYGPDSTGEA
jgi:hypothetical protein